MIAMKKHIQNVMTRNAGKIYSINDFYDFKSDKKNTVKSALYRLNNEGKIVRILDGLYVKLKYNKEAKEYIYPSAEDVAMKIADKYSWKVAPMGDLALNYSGLSSKVPDIWTYASDGPSREYIYRGEKIIFKKTAMRIITKFSNELNLVIQSIIALGKDNITQADIEKLAQLKPLIKENLKYDTSILPYWIKETIDKIAEVDYQE
ncbi:hypothetical protein GE118_00685 [Mycoplasma sp. NEAQ87857]|uniref:DUF6088 family protein n=1 Tax=Mycoplasma sp. NEAQ87857 TaxID=2683967 RepID=UPI001319A831|nr:DUF6088 family protein [Mycoplasma sp. NEAQ87857]QGZ97317.1 hypothetical protein GE118_00685 [Mycoplasma sp. NEAQ87857]